MPKKAEIKVKEKLEECEECPQVAPLYLATFSDMAILLMAFFVLLLAQAIVTEDLYEEQSESTFETGVQAQVEAYNQAAAENLVKKQFTSAPVDPTVFDIIEEDRTDEVQPDDKLKQKRNTATAATNAMEIVEQRFAAEIARGSVEVREEEAKIIVEVTEDFGDGNDDLNEEAKLPGEINDQLLELYLQVVTAQAETGSTIEVLGGSPRSDAYEESSAADDTPKIFQNLLLALDEDIEAGRLEIKREGSDVILTLPSTNGFSSGSAALRPGFLPLLNRIGDALIPVKRIARIEGHTDSVPLAFGGRYRSNWDLSSARAASVADYLLEQRYRNGGEIYIAGFGDGKPVSTNETEAGRAANRRIEIVLPKGFI
ncbi:MAG: hypothetical protein CMQ45_10465 [Gammaproteobacteria bacterium]|nr:hypothetical protein [Gammaproteobacteria bacterium]